jgi:hypothetical protein
LTDYTKATNFASKDSLSTGNPLKIVKGTEIDTEFNNIQTAIATKTDNATAAITGGSITGITDLAVTDGGTGASTASGARTNLSAAASGANSDITSITGLTTPLTVAQGGIGASTLTANNVLLGNGTSAPQTVAPGTSGNVLTSNGTTWTSTSGPTGTVTSIATGNGLSGGTITSTGTLTIAAPSAGSVGSYVYGAFVVPNGCISRTFTNGSDYSAGTAWNQVRNTLTIGGAPTTTNSLSGTWRWLGPTYTLTTTCGNTTIQGLFVRVS